MYLAVDVQYDDSSSRAKVAGVLFESELSLVPLSVFITDVEGIMDYEFGSFYKRELPCVEKLIRDHDIKPDVVIIDGFTELSGKPALGQRLYSVFDGAFPVIGVAKNPHFDLDESFSLKRGGSDRPLYVTSVGLRLELAKGLIQSCSGKFRIPTMLKLADSFCRMDIESGVYDVLKMVRGNLVSFKKVK